MGAIEARRFAGDLARWVIAAAAMPRAIFGPFDDRLLPEPTRLDQLRHQVAVVDTGELVECLRTWPEAVLRRIGEYPFAANNPELMARCAEVLCSTPDARPLLGRFIEILEAFPSRRAEGAPSLARAMVAAQIDDPSALQRLVRLVEAALRHGDGVKSELALRLLEALEPIDPDHTLIHQSQIPSLAAAWAREGNRTAATFLLHLASKGALAPVLTEAPPFASIPFAVSSAQWADNCTRAIAALKQRGEDVLDSAAATRAWCDVMVGLSELKGRPVALRAAENHQGLSKTLGELLKEAIDQLGGFNPHLIPEPIEVAYRQCFNAAALPSKHSGPKALIAHALVSFQMTYLGLGPDYGNALREGGRSAPLAELLLILRKLDDGSPRLERAISEYNAWSRDLPTGGLGLRKFWGAAHQLFMQVVRDEEMLVALGFESKIDGLTSRPDATAVARAGGPARYLQSCGTELDARFHRELLKFFKVKPKVEGQVRTLLPQMQVRAAALHHAAEDSRIWAKVSPEIEPRFLARAKSLDAGTSRLKALSAAAFKADLERRAVNRALDPMTIRTLRYATRYAYMREPDHPLYRGCVASLQAQLAGANATEASAAFDKAFLDAPTARIALAGLGRFRKKGEVGVSVPPPLIRAVQVDPTYGIERYRDRQWKAALLVVPGLGKGAEALQRELEGRRHERIDVLANRVLEWVRSCQGLEWDSLRTWLLTLAEHAQQVVRPTLRNVAAASGSRAEATVEMTARFATSVEEKLNVGFGLDESCIDLDSGRANEHAYGYTHPAMSILNFRPVGADVRNPAAARTAFAFDVGAKIHFAVSGILGTTPYAVGELQREQLEMWATHAGSEIFLPRDHHDRPSVGWKEQERLLTLPHDLGVFYSDLTGEVGQGWSSEETGWVFSPQSRRAKRSKSSD